MPARLTAPALCALAAFLSLPIACSQKAVPPPPAAATLGDSNTPEAQREPQSNLPQSPQSPQPDADAQLRALERAIERDRLRLIALITDRTGEKPALREDPELVEIAERLPRLEEELRRLQERHASDGKENSQ